MPKQPEKRRQNIILRRVVKLSKDEQLKKALKAFPSTDHSYIRGLHQKPQKRTPSERERKLICNKSESDDPTQESLVNWAKLYLNLDVSQPTVSRLLKKSASYRDPMPETLDDVRRKAPPRFPEIDDRVARWFLKYQGSVNMTGHLIKKKAEKYRADLEIPPTEFKASEGWLTGFKKRNGIIDRSRYGESGDVDMDLVEFERPRIRAVLDSYEWCDIYNMDETGLCYQQEVRLLLDFSFLFFCST